jgi:hypothetical protein
MAFRLGTITRNAACDPIVGLMNTGLIQIFDGSQPTNVADASGATLLGTCVFNATAFGAASSGAATANAITSDTNADSTATAGWFRIRDSGDSNTIADGTCGQGTGDLSFDNSAIIAGGTIAITGFVITVPI